MCDTRRRLRSIARRDGKSCFLCGDEVDTNLQKMVDPCGRPLKKFVDIMPTLDHVIPRSKGGRNCATNLRLAHHKCNNARGNGSVTFHVMKHIFLLAHPIQ